MYQEREWPLAARRIRDAVLAAHAAAAAQDAAAVAATSGQLPLPEAEQVRRGRGTTVATMLESRFPDGISGEDLQLVAGRTLQRAAWFPDAEVSALVLVLVQALGVHPDEQPDGVPHLAVVRHAVLLVTELASSPHVDLRVHLDAAFDEIARAETQELP